MTEKELDYKELCKQLFIKTDTIFGMLFVPTRNKQALIDKVYKIAGEAYDLHQEAERKGLYNG
jgi:hypothetical protein